MQPKQNLNSKKVGFYTKKTLNPHPTTHQHHTNSSFSLGAIQGSQTQLDLQNQMWPINPTLTTRPNLTKQTHPYLPNTTWFTKPILYLPNPTWFTKPNLTFQTQPALPNTTFPTKHKMPYQTQPALPNTTCPTKVTQTYQTQPNLR